MKIVRGSLFEVSRDEDDWANQQIARNVDRYKDEIESEDADSPRIQFGGDWYEESDETKEKKSYIISIENLQEFIWENAPMPIKLDWDDYIDSITSRGLGRMVQLENLNIEELKEIYMKGTAIVNSMKQTGNDLD